LKTTHELSLDSKRATESSSSRRHGKKEIFFAFTIACGSYLLFAGQVDNTVTDSDIKSIAKLGPLPQCMKIKGFEAEVECVSAVQQAIRTLLPVNRCPKVDFSLTVEPANFIARGYGCCYSRARFTEKSLRYYGFKTRHLSLHADGPLGIPGTLIPETASHATTEVLTKRGWMGVDSNERFILLTRSGQPLTYKNFRHYKDELRDTPQPADFYQYDLTVVYGLYSRHGMFHGLPLPSPEFNIGELIYNFE
jgi:hypothetical protein